MGHRFSEAFGRRQRLVTPQRLGIGELVAAMNVGLAIFLTGDGIHPAELARAAEERGYESLFVTEHTHIPVAAGMVDRDGGELPDKYRRTHDPFVALAFAAAATEKLIVGTSVCLVIEHDPIVLAKEIASLDVLSGGRFVFGVGAGWNKHEMRNHGTDPDTRHGDMRERVEAMQAIWALRRGRIPRQVRGLRPDLAVAEAAPAAVPGAHRRQRPARRGPRAALRRRLDAEHEGPRDARPARGRAARARRPPRPGDLLRRDAREPRGSSRRRASTAR